MVRRETPAGAAAHSATRAADGCRARRSVLSRAVRASALRSGEGPLARRRRPDSVPDQGADPGEPGVAEIARCAAPRALQHRRLERRAAGVLPRPRARHARRGGEVARDALVGCRHRRPRDRRLGLADRAQCAGSDSRAARPVVPNDAFARVRDVGSASRRVRRAHRDEAAGDAVRLSVGTREHCATRRATRTIDARCRHQGGVRDVRAAATTTSAMRSRACSVAASPTATADATRASSHTNVRRAACTSPPRT